MQDFTKFKNRFNWNEDMLEVTKRLDTLFQKDKILKRKDYILDGESALKMYCLIRNMNVHNNLTISVSSRIKKKTLENRLKGTEFENINILRRVSVENLNKFKNNVKLDVSGNLRVGNLPTLEKVFVDIDSFYGQPDELERAIKKLKEIVSVPKVKKVIKHYQLTSQKISRDSKKFISHIQKEKYRSRLGEETKKIDNVLNLIKDTEAIVFGGIAVEKQVSKDQKRATFDIDILLDEKDLTSLLKKVGGIYYIGDGSRTNDRNDFSKPTVLQQGNKKSTLLVFNEKKDGEIKVTDVKALKVDIDHGIGGLDIKEFSKGEFVHKDEDGLKLVCPEGLVYLKLFTISNNLAGAGTTQWRRRIVRDCVDINLLNVWNKINGEKFIRVSKYFEKNGDIKLNFRKLDLFYKISQSEDYEKVMSTILTNNCIDLSISGSGEIVREFNEFLKHNQTKRLTE